MGCGCFASFRAARAGSENEKDRKKREEGGCGVVIFARAPGQVAEEAAPRNGLVDARAFV